MNKEEYGIVIEFFPFGIPNSGRNKPIAMLLVDDVTDLSLLWAIPKYNITLARGQRVYIGAGKRDEIASIVGRADPSVLGEAAMQFLKEKVKEMVISNEKYFVDILNKLGPINIRLNAFELIPGIGKKLAEKALEEKNKAPFTSYEDFNKRTGAPFNIADKLAERILDEFANKDKYKLFTR
jgi:putative nucleotide binding protein